MSVQQLVMATKLIARGLEELIFGSSFSTSFKKRDVRRPFKNEHQINLALESTALTLCSTPTKQKNNAQDTKK